MRFDKSDQSYLEIIKSKTPNYVSIIIGSRSPDNPLERIVSTIDISYEELTSAVSEVFIDGDK
jgi:hypothetical protein